MIALFSRRDTAKYAIISGAMTGTMVLVQSIGRAGLNWRMMAWAAAAAIVAMLIPLAMGRRLPPDVPLHQLPEGAVREALAPPPPGIARLRVAMPPEPFGAYRIDLYLDGVPFGQGRSGAAVVLPMPLGQHALTMRVWLRRLGATELINALPGTDTDFLITVSGGKSSQYSVKRQDLAATMADRRIVVVGPPFAG